MDTLAMLAASLSSAAVGYLCGLIVGRDTRSTVVMLRESSQTLRAMSVVPIMDAPTAEPDFSSINGDGPQVVTPTIRRGSARGSSPRWMSVTQVKPADNAPLYAAEIQGAEGWFYCSEAYEIGDGRLWQRRIYAGGESYHWVCEPGEWIRCR